MVLGVAGWFWSRQTEEPPAPANRPRPKTTAVSPTPRPTSAPTPARVARGGIDGATPAPAVRFQPLPTPTPFPTAEPVVDESDAGGAEGVPVTSWLEAQVALARRFISSGSIDGVPGAQTIDALKAFQESEGLEVSGVLDDATRDRLRLDGELLTLVEITEDDLSRIQPLSTTWVGKSEQTALDYTNLLELVAERSHAHPGFLKRINPEVTWEEVRAGTRIAVPRVSRGRAPAKAAVVHVSLGRRVLQARDRGGRLLAHFPVSIARNVEKRPVGELRVKVVIRNPDYTFDPAVFPESEEARGLGRKLLLPPGPNNPVGVAWIGLDKPGYGVHGTPAPEQVGRTESHGCFRLANWDAIALSEMAWVGLPVIVDP